ncbi:MAG: hypothetical protein KAX84_17825 [Burkholderiales bacterium]|nr:hypothetical protein [Burkholderiales bacterium]
MKFAIASLSLLLAACTPSQPPAEPAPPADAVAPVAPVTPAPTASEAPAAKRVAGQENLDPLQIFRAFGTEPFWNVNVENTKLTYTTPEDPAGVVMEGTRRALADGVEITGQHDGKLFVLTVSSGTCSDGMSDNTYSLVSAFRHGDIDYKGCGEAAK